jgi:hypothetical protein
LTPAILQIKIEGPPDRISAEALARALTESLAILANIGRAVTHTPSRSKPPLEWFVTRLATASATAYLIAEPTRRDVDQDVVHNVGNGYIDGLRDVETAVALPRFLTDASLDRLNRLTKPLGTPGAQYFEAKWMNGATNDVRVTSSAQRNLTELRSARLRSMGSVTGILDSLSLRGSNKFQVYDDVWERPVSAEFKAEELQRVKDALGERVNVTGTLLRNSKGQPIRVENPRLEVLPPGPPLTSIVGIAPDFLGSLPLCEYMKYAGQQA